MQPHSLADLPQSQHSMAPHQITRHISRLRIPLSSTLHLLRLNIVILPNRRHDRFGTNPHQFSPPDNLRFLSLPYSIPAQDLLDELLGAHHRLPAHVVPRPADPSLDSLLDKLPVSSLPLAAKVAQHVLN